MGVSAADYLLAGSGKSACKREQYKYDDGQTECHDRHDETSSCLSLTCDRPPANGAKDDTEDAKDKCWASTKKDGKWSKTNHTENQSNNAENETRRRKACPWIRDWERHAHHHWRCIQRYGGHRRLHIGIERL